MKATVKKPRTQEKMSDEALKARTGKGWAEWFEILDEAGAKKMTHREITAYLQKKHKVGEWWTQMIAVPYEHARGIREKFQKCDGEFAVSGSRTLNATISKLYAAWTDEKLRRKWLPDAKMEITTATRNKSLRAKWDEGKSRLSVNFYPKSPAKCMAAVDHMKLESSAECGRMKKYWFEALNRLEAELQRAG